MAKPIFPPGEPPAAAQPATPDCINCGTDGDGGYETADFGPFCSSCWGLLNEYFVGNGYFDEDSQTHVRRHLVISAGKTPEEADAALGSAIRLTAETWPPREVIQPLAAAQPATERLIDEIVRQVAELPDRTSPDDWPEAMLVTQAELSQILSVVLHPPASVVQPATLLLDALKRQKAMAENVISFGGNTELDDRYFRGKADGIQQVIDSITYEQQRQLPASVVSPTDIARWSKMLDYALDKHGASASTAIEFLRDELAAVSPREEPADVFVRYSKGGRFELVGNELRELVCEDETGLRWKRVGNIEEILASVPLSPEGQEKIPPIWKCEYCSYGEYKNRED